MVSAVMFVYNEEKYIKEMLLSIINQTKKVDKIIIVDDQSDDGTKGVVDQFIIDYPNHDVLYHYNQKKGKVFAYSKGLSMVETEYFFVCAGDDFLLPNFVETLLGELSIKNCDFVYSKYYIVDSNLQKPIAVKRASVYTFDSLLKSNRVSGYLFGKRKVISYVLPFPDGVTFEDWLTVLLLSKEYNVVHMSNEPLFKYRKHSASTTISLGEVGVRKRDIDFYNYILSANQFDFSKVQRNTIDLRLRYCRVMMDGGSMIEKMKLVFSKDTFFVDKIRLVLLLLPGINNSNDVYNLLQRVLNR